MFSKTNKRKYDYQSLDIAEPEAKKHKEDAESILDVIQSGNIDEFMTLVKTKSPYEQYQILNQYTDRNQNCLMLAAKSGKAEMLKAVVNLYEKHSLGNNAFFTRELSLLDQDKNTILDYCDNITMIEMVCDLFDLNKRQESLKALLHKVFLSKPQLRLDVVKLIDFKLPNKQVENLIARIDTPALILELFSHVEDPNRFIFSSTSVPKLLRKLLAANINLNIKWEGQSVLDSLINQFIVLLQSMELQYANENKFAQNEDKIQQYIETIYAMQYSGIDFLTIYDGETAFEKLYYKLLALPRPVIEKLIPLCVNLVRKEPRVVIPILAKIFGAAPYGLSYEMLNYALREELLNHLSKNTLKSLDIKLHQKMEKYSSLFPTHSLKQYFVNEAKRKLLDPFASHHDLTTRINQFLAVKDKIKFLSNFNIMSNDAKTVLDEVVEALVYYYKTANNLNQYDTADEDPQLMDAVIKLHDFVRELVQDGADPTMDFSLDPLKPYCPKFVEEIMGYHQGVAKLVWSIDDMPSDVGGLMLEMISDDPRILLQYEKTKEKLKDQSAIPASKKPSESSSSLMDFF